VRISDQADDCRPQFVSLEAEWAGLAFVSNPAAAIDQVHAVGPGGICRFGSVSKFIEYRGKLDPELTHTSTRNLRPFIFILRTGKHDMVADVAFHLPDVAGMRLEDIDDKKRDPAAVLVVKLVQGRNLPPERRSSVTAKNEYDGLPRI
jgi:hypothetical protein